MLNEQGEFDSRTLETEYDSMGVLQKNLIQGTHPVPPELTGGFNADSEIATTIIIPAFNEEAALPFVLKPLFNVIDNTYEVLIVDDGSSDRSAAVASQFPCRVIRHAQNAGKGAAMRTGMEHAHGEKVIFIDADNTYPVEMIPTMVQALGDYDMVRGLRLSGRENIPALNRLGNRVFDVVIRALHAVEGGDLLSGMYGGYRDMLLDLGLEANGFAIEAEINVKARARGMTCGTVPITYVERVGDKKLRPFEDGLRILYRVLQLAFTHNPLIMFIIPGHFLAASGALGLGWLLLTPNASDQLSGLFLLSTMLLGGIQLIIFGLAVYEAGMAYGLRGRAHPLLDHISQSLRKRFFMVAGFALGIIGSIGMILQMIDVVIGISLPVAEPVLLLVTALSLLSGFQILSSSAFLSALRGLQVNPTKLTLR